MGFTCLRFQLCHAVGSVPCGIFCAGEFTATSNQDFDPYSSLTVEDVPVDQNTNPSMICIHLKQSKTDPFQHGVDIYLDRTDVDLCPVVALLAYIAVCPAAQRPLFIFRDSAVLRRDKSVVAVRAKWFERQSQHIPVHKMQAG